MNTNYVSHGSFEEPAQAAGGFSAVVPTGWTKPSGNTYLATVGSAIYNPTSLENPTVPYPYKRTTIKFTELADVKAGDIIILQWAYKTKLFSFQNVKGENIQQVAVT